MATCREESRQDWTSRGSVEGINAGSLQRIADATEKMAESYTALIRERDHYKRWYEIVIKDVDQLGRSNSALRGVITKLKRAK